MLTLVLTATGCESSVENGTGSSLLPKESHAERVGNNLLPMGMIQALIHSDALLALRRNSESVGLSDDTYWQLLHVQDDFRMRFVWLDIRSMAGAITIDCQLQRIQG